jgi:hypothetical protein
MDGGQRVSRLARQETPRLSAWSMKFDSEHIGAIDAGQKTVTARLRDEWSDIEAGGNIDIFDDDGKFIGHAIVEETEDFPAASASMALNGAEGHQDYEYANDFLDEFRGYYPEREIDMDTMVRIIYFSLTDSPSADDYQDARELLDEFVRWDCSHCDDGEWMEWTPSGYNARCPECGYTQGTEFKRKFDIQGRAVTDGGRPAAEDGSGTEQEPALRAQVTGVKTNIAVVTEPIVSRIHRAYRGNLKFHAFNDEYRFSMRVANDEGDHAEAWIQVAEEDLVHVRDALNGVIEDAE